MRCAPLKETTLPVNWLYPCLTWRGDHGLLPISDPPCRNQSPPRDGVGALPPCSCQVARRALGCDGLLFYPLLPWTQRARAAGRGSRRPSDGPAMRRTPLRVSDLPSAVQKRPSCESDFGLFQRYNFINVYSSRESAVQSVIQPLILHRTSRVAALDLG